MNSKGFELIIGSILSVALAGCDQIATRFMGNMNGESRKGVISELEKEPIKSLDNKKENKSVSAANEKPKSTVGKEIDNSDFKDEQPPKRKYNVIGTSKDGPYRSENSHRINSEQ